MHEVAAHPAAHQHTAPTSFIRKYIFSLDHKVIGKQYYGLALLSVFIGMVLSWLLRIHLAYPDWHIPLLGKFSAVGAPDGVMTPEYYLSLLTMHGTIMVFFVLTNAPFAAFGNYFLPIQIGAEDMAFPRFNMMSFWTTFVAFLVMMASFFVSDGPPISGWTAYAPLSAVGKDAGPGLAMGQNLWAISIAIFCIASLLGALNFIATTLDLRTRGMSLARMPYSSWAWFVTSVIALLAFAVLLPACVLLILDRVRGTSFFIPGGLVLSDRLQPHSGGSPLLWQHLFWFFGHPEVYIAILPSIGIIATILPVFARKPLLGPRALVGSMIAIGFLSYMVWGHHMFVSGMNPFSANLFSVPTLIITIPALFGNKAGFPVAFFAVTSITTIGLYIAYILPVFLRWRLGDKFEPGVWNLGKHYKWINLIAIVWVVICVVIFCLPTSPAAVPWESGFSWSDFNYAPVVTIALALGVWIAWAAGAKNTFKGPVRTVDDPDVGTPDDPALMPVD